MEQNKNTTPSSQLNELDYLLWVSDYSRIGAIRFKDDNGVFLRTSLGKRETPPLIEMGHLVSAAKAFEENRETEEDLSYLRGNGSSLGGMRPKCSIIDSDGTLAIGKFPSVKDTHSVVHIVITDNLNYLPLSI